MPVKTPARFTVRQRVFLPNSGEFARVLAIYGGAVGHTYQLELENEGGKKTVAEAQIEDESKAIERAKTSGRMNIYRATRQTLLDLIGDVAPSLPNGGEILGRSEKLVDILLGERQQPFEGKDDFTARLQIIHDSPIWDAIAPRLDFAQLDSELEPPTIQRPPTTEVSESSQPTEPEMEYKPEGTGEALRLINNAVSWEQLTPLPGIGNVAAKKIFNNRPPEGYPNFTEIAAAIHDPDQPRQFIRLDWREVAFWTPEPSEEE